MDVRVLPSKSTVIPLHIKLLAFRLDRLLVKAKNSQSELVDEILEPPKPRKTKQAKKGANLEDTDTGTGKELKAIWKAIDEIKTTIAVLLKQRQTLQEKSLTTPARKQR